MAQLTLTIDDELLQRARRHRHSPWDAGIVVAGRRSGWHELSTKDLGNGNDLNSVTVGVPLAWTNNV